MLTRVYGLIIGTLLIAIGIQFAWMTTPITLARADYGMFVSATVIAILFAWMGATIISWEVKRWLRNNKS